jgi:putative heme iron utilization protein
MDCGIIIGQMSWLHFFSVDEDVAPNNTIMVRGLAQHLSENDIRQDILSLGLSAKDIRLIRKKETGKNQHLNLLL